jgi:hypothetical protein
VVAGFAWRPPTSFGTGERDMTIKITQIENGATQVRTALHAFGTAHPFTFGAIILLAAEVLAAFGFHF